MAEQTTIPDGWLRGGVPEWSAIDREIACPRCGYDLRGLAEPRCPECGLEFAWGDALSTPFTVSPWLFEHQWRRRPLRSLLATLWASLRAQRYWKSISIHLRPDATGLWMQFLAAFLLPNILRLAGAGGLWLALKLWIWVDPASSRFELYPRMRSMAASTATDLLFDGEIHAAIAFTTAIAAAFSLIHIATLCSLRQSLARCRVRPIQMLRVAVGTALPFWFLVGSILLGCYALFLTCDIIDSCTGGPISDIAEWINEHRAVVLWPLLAFAVAFGFRHLSIGLSNYLGLPNVELVVFLTSVLAALMLVVPYELATAEVCVYLVRFD